MKGFSRKREETLKNSTETNSAECGKLELAREQMNPQSRRKVANLDPLLFFITSVISNQNTQVAVPMHGANFDLVY